MVGKNVKSFFSDRKIENTGGNFSSAGHCFAIKSRNIMVMVVESFEEMLLISHHTSPRTNLILKNSMNAELILKAFDF